MVVYFVLYSYTSLLLYISFLQRGERPFDGFLRFISFLYYYFLFFNSAGNLNTSLSMKRVRVALNLGFNSSIDKNRASVCQFNSG